MTNIKRNLEGLLDVYVKSALLIRNDHILQMRDDELNKYNLYFVLSAERPEIENINKNGDNIEIDIHQGSKNIGCNFYINEYFHTYNPNKIEHTKDEIILYFTKEDLEYNKSQNMKDAESFIEFSSVKKIKYHDSKFIAKTHISADHYWLDYSLKTNDIMEFNLLYVGQSSRMSGRIKSHKTIQKIQAEYMNKHRDENIYILLIEIDPQIVMGMDGQSNKIKDEKHIKNLTNDIFYSPFEQIVNITEALLIYHFKPLYNDKFTSIFPDIKHKSYQHYFELDYKSIIFEFFPGVSEFGSYKDFPLIKISTPTNTITNKLPNGFVKYSLRKNDDINGIFDILFES